MLNQLESHTIRSRADMLHFCREAPVDTRYVYIVKIHVDNAVVRGKAGCWIEHSLKITHNSLLSGMLAHAIVLLTEWAILRTSLHLERPDAFVVQKTISAAARKIFIENYRALVEPEFPLDIPFRKLKDQLDRDGVVFTVYRRLENASDKPGEIVLPTISA